MQKTVVYVSIHLYMPEQAGTPGVYEQARMLAEAGFRVVVVTGGTHYFTEEKLETKGLYTHQFVENFEVIKTKAFANFRSGFIRHNMFFLVFSVLSFLACFNRRIGRIDFLMINSYPFFFAPLAYIVSKIKKSRVVIYEWDVYPETLEAMGVLKHPIVINSIRRLMNFVRKRAHRVAVCSKGMKNLLENQGIDGNKIVVIPDAFQVPKYFKDTGLLKRAGTIINNREGLIVVFVGHFNRINRIDVVVKAAQILNELDYKIEFEFYGTGTRGLDSVNQRKLSKMDNCRFMGATSSKKIRQALIYRDISVIVRPEHEFWAKTTAGKTFDYLASGTPIVFSGSPNSDNAEIIKSANAGECVQAMRPDEIASKIASLYNDRKRLEAFSKNAIEFCRNNYSQEKMTKLLLSLFDSDKC